MTARNKRRAAVGASTLVFSLLAGCANSTAQPRRPPTELTPHRVLAFYSPSMAVIGAHGWPRNPCDLEASAKETATTVAVSLHEVPVPPGHGSCGGEEGLQRLALKTRVGSRRIDLSSDEQPSIAFNLATRLHPPFTSPAALPGTAEATELPGGWEWTLVYPVPDVYAAVYVLVSGPARPGDQLHTSPRVRNQPSVSPCTALLCWREDGLDYSIDRLGSLPLSKEMASQMAETLSTG